MVAHGGSSVLFLSLAARNGSGALSCAKLSTMGKKIWSSMHPRNFGSEKIFRTGYVRTYVHPFM